MVSPADDSDIGRLLSATAEQLRHDREQLVSLWRRLAKTQDVIDQATTLYKASRALLDGGPEREGGTGA